MKYLIFFVLLTIASVAQAQVSPPVDPAQFVQLNETDMHAGRINDLAWSRDSQRVAVAYEDGVVQIIEPRTSALLGYLQHDSEVYRVSWSPNGALLATSQRAADAYEIWVWYVPNWTHLFTLTGHRQTVESLAWSPDGVMLASGSLTDVFLWDLTTGQPIYDFFEEIFQRGRYGTSWYVTWSPDGSELAASSFADGASLWEFDITNGQPSAPLLIGNAAYARMDFLEWSPDGAYLASGGVDDLVRIWHANRGIQFRVLSYAGHTEPVTSLDWSPDSRYVVAGGRDQTVRIWEVESGDQANILRGHGTERVYQGQLVHDLTGNTVAWSPNGRFIVSGGADGVLRLWGMPR